jgi:hypothetical protein
LFFFFGFVAAGFIPPIPPSYSAEQIKEHYQRHEAGIRVGAMLIMVSGTFYLPYSAVISAQMNRMSHIPYLISALQLASGAACVFTFVLPGVALALAAYRLDRNAEATQTLNDWFWFLSIMPWPSFMTQNFAFAYAIFTDKSPKPVFPKFIAIINIASPILFLPVTFLHFVKSGPIAWNGGVTWWMVAVVFGLQLIFDSFCLIRAIRNDPDDFDTLESIQDGSAVTKGSLGPQTLGGEEGNIL